MDVEFGNTKAALAFFNRNEAFVPKFDRLMALGNKCLARTFKPKNRAEDICFGLGQACRDDFVEVIFVAANGFSDAASKLLRVLYERAVNCAYIAKHPEEAESFVEFAVIQEKKLMDATLKFVSEDEFDKAMGEDYKLARVRERYEKYRPKFRNTMRWNEKDPRTMAEELDGLYTNLYMVCYVRPNLSIHASLVSAARWEGEKNAEHDADFFAFNACWLFNLALQTQNELFDLGLESELDASMKEMMERPPDWDQDSEEKSSA